MLYNLLTNLTEKTREVSISEAALYALLGFSVVFVGIAFLILVVWLVGKFMSKSTVIKTTKTEKPVQKATTTNAGESLAVADATEESLSDETIAVITAAIAAYYEKVNPKCEFIVKRIKTKRI
ncbi:MAG: OadG family protein [Clostridia bacterium]|nr:OadG family protein [Clostridia bacterium]